MTVPELGIQGRRPVLLASSCLRSGVGSQRSPSSVRRRAVGERCGPQRAFKVLLTNSHRCRPLRTVRGSDCGTIPALVCRVPSFLDSQPRLHPAELKWSCGRKVELQSGTAREPKAEGATTGAAATTKRRSDLRGRRRISCWHRFCSALVARGFGVFSIAISDRGVDGRTFIWWASIG